MYSSVNMQEALKELVPYIDQHIPVSNGVVLGNWEDVKRAKLSFVSTDVKRTVKHLTVQGVCVIM